MATKNNDHWMTRQRIIGAFGIGLVLGLILAWRVFPARWVDTDPSDLRAEHQREYVMMVADSWTVTSDANVARERIYQLVEDDADWDAVDALILATISDLEAEGDQAAALRLRRVREDVPLPVEADASVAPSEPEVAEPPAAVEAEEIASSPSSQWPLAVIGLGMVVIVIAAVLWLVSTTMRRREEASDMDQDPLYQADMDDRRVGGALSLKPVPAPGGLDQHTVRDNNPTPVWDDAAFLSRDEETDSGEQGTQVKAETLNDQEETADTDVEDTFFDSERDFDDDAPWAEQETPLARQPDMDPEEAWHVQETAVERPLDTAAESDSVRIVNLPELDDDDLELVDEEAEEQEVAVDSEPTDSQAAEGAQLSQFETVYEFGDDDFYHAFTIESSDHDFLGQCGIVISDVLGLDEAQLVDAFDLWLFETQGTRTVSKVLASEYAYSDENLSAKLTPKGELVRAEEGLVIVLETESLRLSATIEDFEYRPSETEEDSVFEYLKVRMVVEQMNA